MTKHRRWILFSLAVVILGLFLALLAQLPAGGAQVAPTLDTDPGHAFGSEVLPLAAPAPGPVTPLDAPLPEDTVTRIAASYEGEIYHYDLYLPQGYYAEPQRQYPILFIASPDGNAELGNAEGWLRRKRWLVAMLVESSNELSWGACEGNFLAAHDDVVRRVRVHDRLKFATGFSGGARLSAYFVTIRPGFRGLLLQGAGGHVRRGNMFVYATFGDSDFNLDELGYMQAIYPPEIFAYEVFPGGHWWAPVDTVERALDWLDGNVREDEYSISGSIDSNDPDCSSAEITIDSGHHVVRIWNTYIINYLKPGQYTVTAIAPHCWFSPTQHTVIVPPDVDGQDFEVRNRFTISGQVHDLHRHPYPNIPVLLDAELETATDARGWYTFTDLLSGTYQVVPALAGFGFYPPARTATLPPDAVEQGFTILPGPTSTVLVPGEAGVLTYADLQGLTTTLLFPKGAVSQTTALVLTPTLAEAGGGLAFAGHAFDLAAYVDGRRLPGFAFDERVAVTIRYSDQDLRAVAGEGELVLAWRADDDWQDAALTCGPVTDYVRDREDNVLMLSICRTGPFSLFGPAHQRFVPLVRHE